MDFIEAEKYRDDKEVVLRRVKVLLLLVPGVMAFWFLQSGSQYMEKTKQAQIQIERLEQILESQQVLSGLERLEELESQRARLDEIKNEINDAERMMNDIPGVSGAYILLIEEMAGSDAQIVWEENAPVSYEDGVVHVRMVFQEAKGASAFIKRLEQTGEFADVVYTGVEKIEGKWNGYISTVSCSLTPSNIKEGS